MAGGTLLSGKDRWLCGFAPGCRHVLELSVSGRLLMVPGVCQLTSPIQGLNSLGWLLRVAPGQA